MDYCSAISLPESIGHPSFFLIPPAYIFGTDAYTTTYRQLNFCNPHLLYYSIYSTFSLNNGFIEIAIQVFTIDTLGGDHFFARCKRNIFACTQLKLCIIKTDHTPDGGFLFLGNCIWYLNQPVEYHYRRGDENNRALCILQIFAFCIRDFCFVPGKWKITLFPKVKTIRGDNRVVRRK